jgi:hypothetical protein
MDAKRALAHAAEESERLENRQVGIVHLLLGLLHDPGISALLNAHGVDRERVLTYATAVPPEAADDVRSRLYRLIGDLPPELFGEAEQALHRVMSSKLETQHRRIVLEGGATTLETGRTLHGCEVSVTETLESGTEPGTVNYSAIVRAFGEQRSWGTTFNNPSPEP